MKKVVELDDFEGVFTDYKGQLYDLRPKDNCPSLLNFKKKEVSELRELVKTALEAQLAALNDQEIDKYDPRYEPLMKRELEVLIEDI